MESVSAQPLSPAVTLPLAVLFLGAVLCLARILAGKDFRRGRLLAACRPLSRRGSTPLPALAALLVIGLPVLLGNLAPTASPGPAPLPSPSAVVLSSLVQLSLFLGAVVATLFLSVRGTVPNRLPCASEGESAPAPLSLRDSCLKGLLYGIVTLVVVHGVTFLSNLLLGFLGTEPEIQPTVLWLGSAATPLPLKGLLVLQSVLVGPVQEEFLFRFTLLPALAAATGGVRRAILYSTIFFTLLHGSLLAILPLGLFSLLCSLAYLRTGRIATPIAMHVLFNASGVLMVLLAAG